MEEAVCALGVMPFPAGVQPCSGERGQDRAGPWGLLAGLKATILETIFVSHHHQHAADTAAEGQQGGAGPPAVGRPASPRPAPAQQGPAPLPQPADAPVPGQQQRQQHQHQQQQQQPQQQHAGHRPLGDGPGHLEQQQPTGGPAKAPAASKAGAPERPAARGVYDGYAFDPEYLLSCYEDEAKGRADWRYLTAVQSDVDAHRRLVLVDWLVEVADEFKLGQGTLFLAVNLVDRYLSRVPVPRSGLQLLGVAALWLASKFEEVYPPTLADFVDVSQGACSAAGLKAMEAVLLRELRFTLMVPTAVTFLALYLPAAAANAADEDAYLSAAIDGDAAALAGGGSGGQACERADSVSSGGGGGGGAGDVDALSDAGPPSTPACSSGRPSSSGSDASSSDWGSGGALGPCGGAGGAGVGNGAGAGCAGRYPRADAPHGPRGAPRYPYAVGSPCLPPGGAGWHTKRASGAGGGDPAALQPPSVPAAELGDFPRRVAHMAEYLAELSLLTPECLRFAPSVIAAAALRLACSLLGAPPGARARLAPAAELAGVYAGPSGEQLVSACADELRRMFAYACRAPRPPTVRAKYASPKRSCVADTPLPRWAAAD